MSAAVGLLLAGLPWSAHGEGGTPDPLWARSGELAAAARDWIPGKIDTLVEVADPQGNLKTKVETWSSYHLGADGTLTLTVDRSIRDGKDNTDEARRQNSRGGGRDQSLSELLPMLLENRSLVTEHALGRSELVDGRLCDAFAFTMKGKEGHGSTGTAWIDRAMGYLLLLEFTFDPLPLGVKRVDNRVAFAITPSGRWEMRRFVSTGEASLVLFRRIFTLTMTFDGYFEHTPGREAAAVGAAS